MITHLVGPLHANRPRWSEFGLVVLHNECASVRPGDGNAIHLPLRPRRRHGWNNRAVQYERKNGVKPTWRVSERDI